MPQHVSRSYTREATKSQQSRPARALWVYSIGIRDSPCALLFGHEVDGLTEPLRELADTHVRIPMLGQKHSLNVATAGGVVIYELLRKYHRAPQQHVKAP